MRDILVLAACLSLVPSLVHIYWAADNAYGVLVFICCFVALAMVFAGIRFLVNRLRGEG